MRETLLQNLDNVKAVVESNTATIEIVNKNINKSNFTMNQKEQKMETT